MKLKTILSLFLIVLGGISLVGFFQESARLIATVNGDPGTSLSMIWITTQNLRLDTSLGSTNVAQNIMNVPARGIESATVGRIINGKLTVNKINLPSISWLIFNRDFSVPVYSSLTQDNLFSFTDHPGFELDESENSINSPFIVTSGKTRIFPDSEFYSLPESQIGLRRLTYQLATDNRSTMTHFNGSATVMAFDSFRLDLDATFSEWMKELGILILLFLTGVWVNKKSFTSPVRFGGVSGKDDNEFE